MTDNPSETDVESLAEQIDARPWSVEGYTFEGGSDDSFTVTLEVEWVGTRRHDRADRREVIAVVEQLEDQYDEGAPLSVIYDRAADRDVARDTAAEIVDELRRQGDVYEPTTDHLRSV